MAKSYQQQRNARLRRKLKEGNVITMTMFADRVSKLADKAGKTYYTVEVAVGQHKGGKRTTQYKAYVDGFSHYNGETVDESVNKLEAAIFPTEIKQSQDTIII